MRVGFPCSHSNSMNRRDYSGTATTEQPRFLAAALVGSCQLREQVPVMTSRLIEKVTGESSPLLNSRSLSTLILCEVCVKPGTIIAWTEKCLNKLNFVIRLRIRGPFALLRRYRVIMQSDKKHFTVMAAGRQWAFATKKLAKELVCSNI